MPLPATTATDATPIAVTGDTPAAVLTAGLAAVLSFARPESPPQPGDHVVAVPVQGEGDDLTALFTDLVADLTAQLAEWGAGLDRITLDGILRTEAGGFTAWGYLSGDTTSGIPAHPVTITGLAMAEGPPWALTGTLTRGPQPS